ncbi:MAG TPA: metal ABC transporter permease [Clostridia bacterium]|nr:metal ABC transporter permease [Clostridia bacterium]
MFEMLGYDFMQRAVLSGIMVGILCSLVSFFVVLKRLSFIGVGISHSAFGGVAIGYFLGYPPIYAAGIFSVLVAWCIGFVSRKGNIHEETAIGIFFSTAMALGIGLISFTEGYYVDLFGFLFGNILAVTEGELKMFAVVGTLVVVFIVLFFKELLFISFDEEAAEATGINSSLIYYALLTAISLTIVISVKIVGIVLASALLVIPAAIGYQLSSNYRVMLAVAICSGCISTLGGLWLSFQYDIASGATIVLLAALLFFLSFLFRGYV